MAKTNFKRLNQLDHDLMIARVKEFEYLNAVRPDPNDRRVAQSFRVRVAAHVDGGFYATVSAVGRVFRSAHRTPSGAYLGVIKNLKWGLDRWIVEETHRLRMLEVKK